MADINIGFGRAAVDAVGGNELKVHPVHEASDNGYRSIIGAAVVTSTLMPIGIGDERRQRQFQPFLPTIDGRNDRAPRSREGLLSQDAYLGPRAESAFASSRILPAISTN
jgi:hypothetical protein